MKKIIYLTIFFIFIFSCYKKPLNQNIPNSPKEIIIKTIWKPNNIWIITKDTTNSLSYLYEYEPNNKWSKHVLINKHNE